MGWFPRRKKKQDHLKGTRSFTSEEINVLREGTEKAIAAFYASMNREVTQEDLDVFAREYNYALRASGIEPPGWVVFNLTAPNAISIELLDSEAVMRSTEEFANDLPQLIDLLSRGPIEGIQRAGTLGVQAIPVEQPNDDEWDCAFGDATKDLGPCSGLTTTWYRAPVTADTFGVYMRLCEQHEAAMHPQTQGLTKVDGLPQ